MGTNLRTIAITGASGFIGQHALKVLKNYDANIIAVVRDAGNSTLVPDDFEIREFDIGLSSEEPFLAIGEPDTLIHLAWDGLPNYGSLFHFEEELPKQYRFLKSLLMSGMERLVISGTCFEYGMQMDHCLLTTTQNLIIPMDLLSTLCI